MNKYLTINEAAEIYRISKSSLYRLAIEDPSFPAINVGIKKKIVIEQTKLLRWIESKNFKDELIKLPSNTIVFRRRIHETSAS